MVAKGEGEKKKVEKVEKIKSDKPEKTGKAEEKKEGVRRESKASSSDI